MKPNHSTTVYHYNRTLKVLESGAKAAETNNPIGDCDYVNQLQRRDSVNRKIDNKHPK